MRTTRRILTVAVAIALISGVGATAAQATRDRPPALMSWEWQGGTPHDHLSVDGPKSSNSYNLDNGAYVYRRGYWDIPFASYGAGFSYQNTGGSISDGGGSPRISIILEDSAKAETGDVIYLDPYWCPSAYNSAGWADTNFFRTGNTCTIYGSWDGTNGYTGDNAVPNVSPATSAWSKVVAAAQGRSNVYAGYGFLLAEQPGTTVVDRVRFGGDVLSVFPTNAAPDADHDGVVDRKDNCPGVVSTNVTDTDGDGTGDVCDADLNVDGTYAGDTNNPTVGAFNAAVYQNDPEATGGTATSSDLLGGAPAGDCFPLSGHVTLTFGSSNATGTVRNTSTVCLDTVANDGSYDLNMWVDLTSGSVYGKSTIGGAVHFVGDNSAFTSGVIRNVSGTVTGTITAS